MPGMSLTYAWFKSGFPLPLHSHNADCLYYIIAGTLKLEREELGAGDGFFVGKDAPDQYKPGPTGVEVLEFRTADTFDIASSAIPPPSARRSPRWRRSAAERLAAPAARTADPGMSAPA
ncbi:cupin domain-containing protein [Sphingomonas sp. MMS24-JH45]